MELVRYHNGLKNRWDSFNALASNGTFFFNRSFMEYHRDRFTDHSLLFFVKGKLIAILPMHAENQIAASHLGLSFGGLLFLDKIQTTHVIQIFEHLLRYLQEQGFQTFLYKPPSFVYTSLPIQDDLYALFHLNAVLSRRILLSVLDLSLPLSYSKLRQRCLKKAKEANLTISAAENVTDFMKLVTEVYQDRGISSPTHSVAEMQYLKEAFPDNISLLVAHAGEELMGGVLLFEHRQVINLQYMATSPAGKELHALDLLVHFVIAKYKSSKRYLSFGSSQDEREPYGLNHSLLQNKFSYGARGVVQDTYAITL